MTTVKQNDELDKIIDDLTDLKNDLYARIEELENLEVDKLEDIDNEDLIKILRNRHTNHIVIVEDLNLEQHNKLMEFITTEIWPNYNDQVKHIL